MKNFTFLTESQIFGSEQLDIIKKRGTKAAITDFSILLGGYVSDNNYIAGGSSLKERTGYYWTKTDDGDNDARVVSLSGNSSLNNVSERDCGSRPALTFSSLSEIPTNGVSSEEIKKETASDGIIEVYYGFYPQTAVNKSLQLELERAYNSSLLNLTGNSYTTDSRKYNEYDDGFLGMKHNEYEYNGKRYVRVIANSYYDGDEFTLSNGEKYKNGDPVWIEVEPIKWLVDEKNKIMLTDKIVFSGVQFNKTRDYHTENFDRTDIKKFMDDDFSKDIIQNMSLELNIESFDEAIDTNKLEKKSRLQKLNPDSTKQSERRKMTYTEIIHNWIEAGQSVLLRGPSGIGKTERIKKLYPNLVYLKLTNSMFPEKIVGSVNLQTGESIPPDFAKQIIMECSTDEEKELIRQNIQNIYSLADTVYERSKSSSNKIVILLDELLNVKPPIQSLVYTLVLNRLVEIGGGLRLPANTVIVATGNQKKYSNVAEDLAQPLEKRFDHILDMDPKVGEWISEYAIPNKVHPSVIGYIFSKYIQTNKSESISDINYFYEEPEVGEKHLDKYGCYGRTNDPRGWVSISNTLYAFEKDLESGKLKGFNVEDILKISLDSKLREEWAREFYNFYNMPTLSVNDVVSKNYTQIDLPRNINERFAHVSALLLADENEVSYCRDFIRNYCDPEYLQLYDICWVGNDIKRMQKIVELNEMSSIKEDIDAYDKGVGKRR